MFIILESKPNKSVKGTAPAVPAGKVSFLSQAGGSAVSTQAGSPLP